MEQTTILLIFFGSFVMVISFLLLLFRDDVKKFLAKTTYQPGKDVSAFIPTASIEKRCYLGEQVFQEITVTCSALTHKESMAGCKELLKMSMAYDPKKGVKDD